MKSLHRFCRSEKGASMLYVLAALIVTGFISVAMLKMVGSDATAGVFYSTSASARSAAKSGIISAINFFEDSTQMQTRVIPLLQKWVNAKTKADLTDAEKWIGGSDAYVDLSSDGTQQYRTEILAFDPTNFSVTLRSDGIGKGNARASMTAVYRIEGLGYSTDYDWTNENAMYLGDGVGLNTHAALDINGNVFVADGSQLNFDNSIDGSVFQKNFVVGKAANATSSFTLNAGMSSITIDFEGPAYFGTRPWMSGQVNFVLHEKSGFEYGALMSGSHNTIDCDKDTYWNGNPERAATDNSEIEGDGSTVLYHNGAYTSNINTVANGFSSGNIVNNSGDFDIPAEVGITTEQCEIIVDPNVLPSSVIVPWNAGMSTIFTEVTAQQYYNDAVTNSSTWNGFAVVRLDSDMQIGTTGGKFDGKMILLVNGNDLQVGLDASNAICPVFSCEPDANFTIINNNNGTNMGRVLNFGGADYFRGLLWSDAGSTFHVGGATPAGYTPNDVLNFKELKGAVYASDNVFSMEWFPHPSTGKITYDGTVYEELDYGNFLIKDNCPDENAPLGTELRPTSTCLDAHLISQTM